jgi:Heavy metal binding domain
MYVCPMHPEVRQEGPGHCPKCGMKLVLDGTQDQHAKPHVDDKGLGMLTWHSYLPLLVIFALLLAVSAVASWKDYAAGIFSLPTAISYFMTGFFLVFSGFKLIDLKGFAEGYSTYDLLAQRWFGYGYVYPFIELGFGLAMLAGLLSPTLLWAEVVVMLFSGIGVSIKLAKGEEFQCACLGTFLKVPLTKITLIEDFGMALLALVLILLR